MIQVVQVLDEFTLLMVSSLSNLDSI